MTTLRMLLRIAAKLEKQMLSIWHSRWLGISQGTRCWVHRDYPTLTVVSPHTGEWHTTVGLGEKEGNQTLTASRYRSILHPRMWTALQTAMHVDLFLGNYVNMTLGSSFLNETSLPSLPHPWQTLLTAHSLHCSSPFKGALKSLMHCLSQVNHGNLYRWLDKHHSSPHFRGTWKHLIHCLSWTDNLYSAEQRSLVELIMMLWDLLTQVLCKGMQCIYITATW